MLNSNVSIPLFFIIFLLAVNGHSYHDKYRLQVHYSIESGWGNDPNGLIYAGGYYHLFYQHDPNETVFIDRIRWGHARSKDLIHWETMPIAIDMYNDNSIYSGCCISDTNNVTGFAKNQTEPPLIAIYTLNKSNEGKSQRQAISYSLDDGITWTQYVNNPIIPNPGVADFRDPNVFHRDGKFYMTVTVGDRIRFFSSVDLKIWHFESDFGVNPDAGDKSGVWECPSIITLKDEQDYVHDILIVSENGLSSGSMTQYFVGKFNGTHFINYNQSKLLWFDDGFDNYATISFNNNPFDDTIMIGWMSNWLYANNTPTSTWRGQYTIPRKVTLKTVDEKLYLAQRPIDELNNIIDSSKCWSLSQPTKLSGYQILDLTERIPFELGPAYTLEFEYDIEHVTMGELGIKFSNSFDEFISYSFDLKNKTFEFDRRKSGNVSFSPRFANTTVFKRISNSNILSAKLILDTTSIEKFIDDGLNTFTAIFFPTEPYNKIQLFAAFENARESAIISTLSVSKLKSIWSES